MAEGQIHWASAAVGHAGFSALGLGTLPWGLGGGLVQCFTPIYEQVNNWILDFNLLMALVLFGGGCS